MEDIKKQIEILKRGVVEIIPENGLVEKLNKAKSENRPLIIKLGADPSAPDIHLGHTVVLRKLRQFQQLGHQVVFLVGDFTAMIGDPSGQSKTRRALTPEEVKKNAETYKEQIFKILDENKTIIRFNSEWCSPMNFADVIKLTSKYTVARMLERDDFSKRYHEGRPISITEFLYSLIQGYDSVILKADVELGGTDQKFNLLVGRELQKEYGQDPQVCICMPIIEGLDGVKKMSKSLGNYIGINDSPKDMFGKTMSIGDELMFKYFELLTDIPEDTIKKYKEDIKHGANPRDIKVSLGMEIVKTYYAQDVAEKALEEFNNIFQKKEIPDDIITFNIGASNIGIADLIVHCNFAPSKSEAKRLIKGGGVYLDNETVTNENLVVNIDKELILKVGKRKFGKIVQ